MNSSGDACVSHQQHMLLQPWDWRLKVFKAHTSLGLSIMSWEKVCLVVILKKAIYKRQGKRELDKGTKGSTVSSTKNDLFPFQWTPLCLHLKICIFLWALFRAAVIAEHAFMSYTFHTTGNMAFQWELETGNWKKQKNKQMHEWNPIIMDKMNAMN